MSSKVDSDNEVSHGSSNGSVVERSCDTGQENEVTKHEKWFLNVGDSCEWLIHNKLLAMSHMKFVILVGILGLVAYSPNILVHSDNPWIYDDQVSILRNPCVIGIGPMEEYVPWSCLFYVDYWGTPIHTNKSHKSYRPVTSFFHRVQHSIFGLQRPCLWHLTSATLHSITSVLFYLAMREFTKEMKREYATAACRFASLLFVLHPVHAESVSNFTGLAEVLCGLFMLMSYVIFERRIGGVWLSFTGAVFCAVLATLSKEVGIAVLAIIVVSIVSKEITYFKATIGKRHELPINGVKAIWNAVLTYISLFRMKTMLLLLAYMLATLGIVVGRLLINVEKPTFSTGMNPGAFNKNLTTRTLTLLFYAAKHFSLLIFPYFLCPDYANTAIPLLESILDSRVFWLVAFFVPLFLSLKFVLEKVLSVKTSHHSLILGLAWLVLPFIPASNLFFVVGFAVAERVLYSPSIGFCMLVGLGAAGVLRILHQKKHQLMRRIFHSSITLLMGCLLIRTVSRDYDWNSANRLWLRSYDICSPSGAIIANSALCLKDMHRIEEAIHLMRYVVAISKDEMNPQSMLNLAGALRETGKMDEAEKICEGPASHGDLGAMACMADIYFRRKEYNMTFETYQAILNAPNLDLRHMPVPREKAILDSLVSLRMLAIESGDFELFDIYSDKALEEQGVKERFRCSVKLEQGKAAGDQDFEIGRDQIFSEVLHICPNDMDVYMTIAEYLKNSKDFPASKAVLLEAHERLPQFSWIIKRRTMEVELENYLTHNLSTTYEIDIVKHEMYSHLVGQTPLNCIYILAKDFVQNKFDMRGGLDLIMMKEELRKAFEGYEFEQVQFLFLAHINRTMSSHEFGVVEAYAKMMGDGPEQVGNFFRDVRESLDAFAKFIKDRPPSQ